MPPRAEKLPPLVIEDIEPRLAIRLVVMLPTGSGVEFMERSAKTKKRAIKSEITVGARQGSFSQAQTNGHHWHAGQRRGGRRGAWTSSPDARFDQVVAERKPVA